MINLSRILRSRQVKSTIPVFFEHKEPPTVSYKYTKTTGPSVFNFKKVTESIILSSNDCTTCNCSSSAYLYQPLGHVVTGDLSIITNRKLRHLIKKDPNFREQNNINWDLCLKLCMEGVHNYRDTWASREVVDPCTLNEWVGMVKLLIENNIRPDVSSLGDIKCLKLCIVGVYNYRDTWASREGVDPCTLNEWAGTVKLLIENNIRPDISSLGDIKREKDKI